ncbi:MAG: zinc-ribbon domain-containing protein [Clostridia bacterium]|nr:zinc-ribbon domain-containing protein [Clostridia bacterium]
MFCSKCGNPVDKENTFCPNCGNRICNDITNSQSNLTSGLWQDIKTFFKTNKTIIGILLLIASLFIIMCAVIDLIQSGGNSSQNSWRDPSEPTRLTGPIDIILIGLGILGIFISINLFKTKK